MSTSQAAVEPMTSVDDQLRVGVVGLGAIGRGICESLSRSGHPALVFDIRREAFDGLDCVAGRSESAAELALDCDVVLLAVLDDTQAREALLGINGILAGSRPGLIVVLLSTVSVTAVREFGGLCASRDVDLLDCGVTPGDQAALNGVVGFLGGPEDVVARAMPVLKDFAREIVHCGPLGAGMTVKIARNLLSYCAWAAVDEAVNLAVAAGVSPTAMYRALREADAKHPQYLKMLDVREADFEIPADRIDNALATAAKDLTAAIDLASSHGVSVPLAELTKPLIRDVFERNRTTARGA
jgi:3-hydroxyisobutyrate dehydrogenase-like beta-hydroxyacid dehydrogenase